MTNYIKYSERNNILDPFLAKLVDHIERVIGWDIEEVNQLELYLHIKSGKYNIFRYDRMYEILHEGRMILTIEHKVFEQEYTNLLSHYKN